MYRFHRLPITFHRTYPSLQSSTPPAYPLPPSAPAHLLKHPHFYPHIHVSTLGPHISTLSHVHAYSYPLLPSAAAKGLGALPPAVRANAGHVQGALRDGNVRAAGQDAAHAHGGGEGHPGLCASADFFRIIGGGPFADFCRYFCPTFRAFHTRVVDLGCFSFLAVLAIRLDSIVSIMFPEIWYRYSQYSVFLLSFGLKTQLGN